MAGISQFRMPALFIAFVQLFAFLKGYGATDGQDIFCFLARSSAEIVHSFSSLCLLSQ
jgi:hypothetical protein